MNIIIVLVFLAATAFLLFSKKLAKSSNWNATLTPLASIMGSGFLVSAPLLAHSVGNLAIFCIAGLLVVAYLIGGAIRYNIQYFEPIEHKENGTVQCIASVSRLVLVCAYFISVTYYLELLAAFALNMFHIKNHLYANLITSGILIFIGLVGIFKGLSMLEKVEKYAISINLGAIAALLVALIIYNIEHFMGGTWHLPSIPSEINFKSVQVLLGLLIIVQGFETSRYLGDAYPAKQRIKTMRYAQIISSVIYLIFIAFVTVLFKGNLGADVTAVIKMVGPVALILPILLSVAAIGSQFSASVADNSGAGGLIEDITNKKVPLKFAYLLLLIGTLFIAWETHVNQIIAYASRAFALYYTLQCIVSAIVAKQNKHSKSYFFIFLSIICFAVFIFGVPSG